MKQSRSSFKCYHCGNCCTKLVKLTDEDIWRISRLGYKDFVKYDPAGNPHLRMRNRFCIFLKIEDGKSTCKIYPARPKVCRDYPFFQGYVAECKPMEG